MSDREFLIQETQAGYRVKYSVDGMGRDTGTFSDRRSAAMHVRMAAGWFNLTRPTVYFAELNLAPAPVPTFWDSVWP
jgi:hypothetical protein